MSCKFLLGFLCGISFTVLVSYELLKNTFADNIRHNTTSAMSGPGRCFDTYSDSGRLTCMTEIGRLAEESNYYLISTVYIMVVYLLSCCFGHDK